MKHLFWFTHTNIDTRNVNNLKKLKAEDPEVIVDLSNFLEIFKKNEIWKRRKYRTEYVREYDIEDFSKISSIKLNLHSENFPYSNEHSYEAVIDGYVGLKNLETSKITASGIGAASQIAVLAVEFESNNKIIDNLTHEEEKNIEIIFDKKLTSENIDSWHETAKIKSICCEFMQFYIFNLHLNFLSKNYTFSFTDKSLQTGFTTTTDFKSVYCETDKIDLLSHYIFYQPDIDVMAKLMTQTINFWHIEIPTIHFFLNALKGTYITIDNFSKLVYTLESFFTKKTSNDFMCLSVPLLIGKDVHSMKKIRETLRLSFYIRNNYVHGEKIVNLNSSMSNGKSIKVEDVFFDLKNLIIQLFYFYINNNLYLSDMNEKINHELLFRFLPNGIMKK